MKRIVADRDRRVVARLALPQLRAHARQQDREPKRLRDIIVGAGIEACNGVFITRMASQKDDRAIKSLDAGIARDVPAIAVGQADVQEQKIRPVVFQTRKPRFAVRRFCDSEFRMQCELFDESTANILFVVDDQDLAPLRHHSPVHAIPQPDGRNRPMHHERRRSA